MCILLEYHFVLGCQNTYINVATTNGRRQNRVSSINMRSQGRFENIIGHSDKIFIHGFRFNLNIFRVNSRLVRANSGLDTYDYNFISLLS